MARISTGLRHPRNYSMNAKGSIHDDDTALELGFRGGTVAGSIHLDQFGSICVEALGREWFEHGYVSLYFQQPTTDLEPVDAWIEGDAPQLAAGMTTPEGAVVAEGNVGIGNAPASALHARDRRGVDPSSLRMLAEVRRGQATDTLTVRPDARGQRARISTGSITDDLSWYADSSPWGGAVSSPLTSCQMLVSGVTDSIAASCGPFVGLYGAIEVRHLNGPVFLDREYVITGEVLDVSETPKTEVLWFRTQAREVGGSPGDAVAECTMMTRLLKASSPRYRD